MCVSKLAGAAKRREEGRQYSFLRERRAAGELYGNMKSQLLSTEQICKRNGGNPPR